MNACSNAFAGGDSNSDEEHDDKEQSYRKGDFVDGNITGHFHAVVADSQIDTSSIKVTEDIL